MKKNEILEKLKNQNQAKVKFVKKNGEIREMDCTQNLDMIPSEKHPKTNNPVEGSNIRVFDLEKNDWRSFNVNSVQSVS